MKANLATAAYETSKHRLLVLGGSGFVGGNVLQRAVQKGLWARSLSPTGKPRWRDVPWIHDVDWQQGDLFDAAALARALEGVTGVSASLYLSMRLSLLLALG